MTSSRFRDWFQTVHFDWRTGETVIPAVGWASVEARMFIWPGGQPHPYFLRGDVDDLRQRLADDPAKWEQLSQDVKLEVLALCTVAAHENTHRVDMLTTPFGAMLAVAALQVYVTLEQIAPALSGAESKVLAEPLINLEMIDETLRTHIGLLSSFDRSPREFIEPGWGGGHNVLTLLGKQYDTLTILGNFETIRTSERPFNYITLRTILECRGLAHALRQVRSLFGYDHRAARREMARYFNAFYANQIQWHDYRFLLDQIALAAGHKDFGDLLAGGTAHDDGATLEQFEILMSAVCWVALHAVNPVVQLCSALTFAQMQLSGRSGGPPRWANIGEMLNDFDELLASYGQPGSQSILSSALSMVVKVRPTVEKVAHPAIRDHFGRVLDMLRFQLQRRIDSNVGFLSAMGMTYDGDPFHHGVDVQDIANVITMLTGDDLDRLLAAEDKPIVSPRPPKDLVTWFEHIPSIFLRAAKEAEVRRQWLTTYYRIVDVLCPNCFSPIPVSSWLQRQRLICSACRHTFDIDLNDVTIIDF